jgi:hypothetical protein
MITGKSKRGEALACGKIVNYTLAFMDIIKSKQFFTHHTVFLKKG